MQTWKRKISIIVALPMQEENLTVCDYLLAMLIFDFKQIVFGTYILMIVTTAKH
jgi:hypothetical protein